MYILSIMLTFFDVIYNLFYMKKKDVICQILCFRLFKKQYILLLYESKLFIIFKYFFNFDEIWLIKIKKNGRYLFLIFFNIIFVPFI